MKTKKNILRLISGNKVLALKVLSGQAIIAEANKVFNSYISPDFIDLGLNQLGIATPKTQLQVYDMIYDGTSLAIFNSLPGTWNQKCLSQHQIINFCQTLSVWLKPGELSNLFLCKIDERKPIDDRRPHGNSFIVRVEVFTDGLFVAPHRLEDYRAWNPELRSRVILPKVKEI